MLRSALLDRATTACCPSCGKELDQPLPFTVDLMGNAVLRGTVSVKMSPTQAELIWFLHRRFPYLVPTQEIVARVWGVDGDPSEKNVHTVICLARRYLEKVGYSIQNERGCGYRLVKL